MFGHRRSLWGLAAAACIALLAVAAPAGAIAQTGGSGPSLHVMDLRAPAAAPDRNLDHFVKPSEAFLHRSASLFLPGRMRGVPVGRLRDFSADPRPVRWNGSAWLMPTDFASSPPAD